MLADATFAQYRSELRSTPDNVDWLPVLGLINEVVRGGQALRRTHGEAGPLPWPGVAGELRDLGQGTAHQLREVGELMIMKTPGSKGCHDRGGWLGECVDVDERRRTSGSSGSQTPQRQSASSISGDGWLGCPSIADG